MENNQNVGYLEEESGSKSSMRLMCMLSLIFSMVCAVITLLFADAAVISAGVFITTAFIVGAFAPKAIQKFAEAKITGITS